MRRRAQARGDSGRLAGRFHPGLLIPLPVLGPVRSHRLISSSRGGRFLMLASAPRGECPASPRLAAARVSSPHGVPTCLSLLQTRPLSSPTPHSPAAPTPALLMPSVLGLTTRLMKTAPHCSSEPQTPPPTFPVAEVTFLERRPSHGSAQCLARPLGLWVAGSPTCPWPALDPSHWTANGRSGRSPDLAQPGPHQGAIGHLSFVFLSGRWAPRTGRGGEGFLHLGVR